jgi:4-carboxymuconolactone decarboxylase
MTAHANGNRASEGAALRARAQGGRHRDLQSALGSIDPRMAEWADGFIFGDVWARAGIAFEDRMLVAIVALAATERPNQLRNYLHGALQDGMDPRRIHEALLMLVVYVGWPVALQSLVVWQEVVHSARKRGVEMDLPMD